MSEQNFVAQPGFMDWRKFKANGHGKGAEDEWSLCKKQGSNVAAILEQHYETFFTESDIDTFAAVGVNLLRIPTTYASWIVVPGSAHYHRNQIQILKRIATYAIENKENLDLSYKAVGAVVDFIQSSGHIESYTLAPVNEAVDNKDLRSFGTDLALSDKATDWLLKYYLGTVRLVEAINSNIPVMLQDSFKNEAFWAPRLPRSANIIIDCHSYHFIGRALDLKSVPAAMVGDAKRAKGTGTFPVLIGEWSLEAELDNDFRLRKATFDAGRFVFDKYVQGSCFWSAKVFCPEKVHGEGIKQDYWSYSHLIQDGVVQPVDPSYKYE